MAQHNLDLARAGALAQILPAPPQITSEAAKWSNLMLAHYHEHPGCESPEAIFQQHALEVIHENSRSHHERRMGSNHLSYQLSSGETCFCPAYTSHWTVWEHWHLIRLFSSDYRSRCQRAIALNSYPGGKYSIPLFR